MLFARNLTTPCSISCLIARLPLSTQDDENSDQEDEAAMRERYDGVQSFEYKLPEKGKFDDEDIDSDDVCPSVSQCDGVMV